MNELEVEMLEAVNIARQCNGGCGGKTKEDEAQPEVGHLISVQFVCIY